MGNFLTKGCEPEHRLPETQFLRLGSQRDYWRTSNKEIRDLNEGVVKLSLNLKRSLQVKNEHLAFLFPAMVPFQGFSPFVFDQQSFHSGKIGALGFGQDADSCLVDGVWEAEFRYPNSFFFCMSLTNDRVGKISGYPSCWSIPLENAEKLAGAIKASISQTIHLGQTVDSSVLDFIDIVRREKPELRSKGLEVDVVHGPVSYGRKVIEIDRIDNDTIREVDASYRKQIFSKDSEFEKEQEYRFVVSVSYLGWPMPVYPRHCFLPSSAFRELDFV